MTIRSFLAIVGVTAATAIGAGVAYAMKKRRQDDGTREILVDGLRRHAELYDGLYEGIYRASLGQANRDALREWCIRTEGLEEDAPFAGAFAAWFGGSADAAESVCQTKLRELLALLEAAGILRGEETETVMGPKARRAYIYLGNPAPGDGVRCAVMKPTWTCNGRLVEQGILTAKEG